MATEKPFFIGARTIEELEAKDALKNNTTATADVTKTDVIDTTTQNTNTTAITETNKPPADPPKNEWLGEAGKIYGSEFKTPEELGEVFKKAKSADEYQTKLQELTISEKKYQQQIADLNSSLNPLTYFSSQESYVAEQLKKQRQDLDPQMLGQVISTNADQMSDIDVLIKNELLKNPKLIGREEGAKGLIHKRYGIDPTIPKEEWDITTQNEMLVAASTARKEWNELKTSVKLPTVATPEQIEAERATALAQKKQALTPLKDTFSKFDKFTEQIEDGNIFEFDVPDEYKKVLPEMFETYFVEAGLEPDADSLASMEKLKRALFLEGNFKQIYKNIEAKVEAREKAKRDELLGNNNPPNTRTALELKTDERKKFSNEHGLGKMFKK